MSETKFLAIPWEKWLSLNLKFTFHINYICGRIGIFSCLFKFIDYTYFICVVNDKEINFPCLDVNKFAAWTESS